MLLYVISPAPLDSGVGQEPTVPPHEGHNGNSEKYFVSTEGHSKLQKKHLGKSVP